MECLYLGIRVRGRLFGRACLRWRHSSSRRSTGHSGHHPHLRLEGWTCRREEARGVAKSCHGGVEGGVCGQLSCSLTPMKKPDTGSETVDSIAQKRSLGYTQRRGGYSCVVVVDGKTFDLGNKLWSSVESLTSPLLANHSAWNSNQRGHQTEQLGSRHRMAEVSPTSFFARCFIKFSL